MGVLIAAAAMAHAPRLGGGAVVGIPWARIAVALLLCSGVALLAVLWLRQRGGWPRVGSVRTGIEVVESRRLNHYADVSLVRLHGREYAILSSAQQQRVLSSVAVPEDGR